LPEDELSCVAYNTTGSFSAVGDVGGRLVIFRNDSENSVVYDDELQAHDNTFDVWTNREIRAEVTALHWCPWGLLSANQRTVKLWNIRSRRSSLKRTYDDRAHVHTIHSVCANSDGATMLSADDLVINMWSLETRHRHAFQLFDMRPNKGDEIKEAITRALFHPRHCHEMAWTSTSGAVSIVDLRIGPHISSSNAKVFKQKVSNPGYYDAVTKSISDASYVDPNGTTIVTRDYIHLKLWDVRFESSPVHTWPIHAGLRPMFDTLYEHDAIFDKFHCSVNEDGTRIATGTYSNKVAIFNVKNKHETEKLVKVSSVEPAKSFQNPILHHSFSYTHKTLAVATLYGMYFFTPK